MYRFRRFPKMWYWLHASLVFALLFSFLTGAARGAPASSAGAPADNVLQEPALLPPTPPPPSTGAAPAAERGVSSATPNCALLDDPTARGMMSGALETALLHACGRKAELTPPAASAFSAPLRLQSITALGDDVLVNDPTGEMTSMTQNNVVVAYNEDTGVLCAAYTDSYHGYVQNQGYTGFSSSTDGGATWSDHGAVTGGPGESYGLPSLVWRRSDGYFYLVTLYSGGLGLWRLGANCDAPTWIGHIHVGVDDRAILAADNNPSSSYYGRLYAVWMDAGDGHIYAARSSDGGQIWSTPVDVSGHNQVNGPWPAVDPVTGDVYVAWTHWDVYPDGPIDVEMARSSDGGATWTPLANPMSDRTAPRDATATTHCSRPALNGNIRYYPFPQIAVDRNRVLHAVYSYDPDSYNTGDVVNVYYRRSLDQGATWETQIRVNDDWTGRDQFSPALAVGETGVIGVFWYDRRLDSANVMYDRYMALSHDGGQTFEANRRVSDESSPVVLDPALATCYHGDYDGAAAGGGYFYTVWGDDRRGDADVWSDSEPYLWGRLYGTVYDATTMRGVEQARVEIVHAPTNMLFSVESDATGYYEARVPDDAVYSVTALAYGYIPNTVAATVGAGDGQADVPLTPAFWSISGRVTDANTGYPVHARVTVTGDPFDPPAPYNETWSDPFTGAYSLPNLAARIPYTLTFEALGYISKTHFTGELSAPLTSLNQALQPDLGACAAPGYEMAPPCQPASGAVLQPTPLEVEGCPCEAEAHTLYFANHTGADQEILLSYASSPGVSVQLPASLGVVPNTGVKPFEAALKIDRGVLYSTTVYVTVTARLASNPAVSDTTRIEKRVLEPTEWEARAESPSPSMDGAVIEYGGRIYNVGGYGSGGAVDIYDPATDSWTTGASEPSPLIDYPVDACFGYATPTDPVILLLPDATGAVTGVWHRYHIINNTWDTPALPASLPANGIWASDIVVDYRANMCYITGGATVAGNGNLTTLYRYDPAGNAATLLGNFTHIPTGFDFHAGWYAPWIGTAGGVCVGGGVDNGGNVYADTQCYDIATATFHPPNADLGPLPEPWWGMADMEKVATGGRQLWIANGIDASGGRLQRSAYFSREMGKFAYGPDPLYSVYRVEGAAVQDKVYVVDGSTGGFDPSTLNEQLLQCPACDCGAAIEKEASAAWAYPGEVVTYTVVITAPNWLTGTAELVDALPPGATFAGLVDATYGTAWYSATENAIYWTRPLAALRRTAGAFHTTAQVGTSFVALAPSMPTANASDLPLPPHARLYAPAAIGDVIETFTNTWGTNVAGLLYNPESGFVRYAHEGYYGVFDVDYPTPHPVLHNFKLSTVNPAWPTSLDNRNGVGHDYTTGHYFLSDYHGDISIRYDNIVEIDPAGRIVNAWETDGTSNDSYDSSIINGIIDIAVAPGAPTRYFATAIGDGNIVYEIDLRQAGLFTPNTWGTVMTCTVPGITETVGIDYDAQNGVLYHSDWNSSNIVVTDLHCNVLDAFVCSNGVSNINTGVTFVEGVWPPEVWVTDHVSNRTTRCEAVGHEPHPEVVTVTYAVQAVAPVSTTLVNTAILTYDAPGCADPSALSLLLIRTTPINGSVQRALDELGYTYDTLDALSDWTKIDFTPYDAVIIGADGGAISITSTQKIRTDVIDRGKRAVFIGGSQWANFVNGVNQYLVQNNTASYAWAQTASPHFTLTQPAHPLARGLPASRDFVNNGARYYQLRATDPHIEIIARNGDGYPSYFYKTYPGGGDLAWFVQSPSSGYWGDPGDFSLLERIIANALARPRQYVASAAFHVAPRPAITWTKEIYINGNYVGRYDEGPFTAVSTDDVQLVDRLDYVGVAPLFVQLTDDWGSYPVELTNEHHTRGVVTAIDGDWYATLPPGTSARLVKTVRITDTVPVTIYERLHPEGMLVEERAVAFQPPLFSKDGPAKAYPDQIITYTITFSSRNPLVGALRLTDTLPVGVEYAGNLHASYGDAWYDGGDNAVYWANTPASMLTTQHILGAGTQSETALSEETKSGIEAWPEIGPLSAQNALTPYSLLLTPSSPSATWFSAAPLPTSRVRYAHAQCPGEPNRFYVISGVPTGAAESMWRYDADTDIWTTLARFPAPVEGPSAVCYQGHIYVAGGNGTNQFYIYDIARDIWTAGPALPRGVWGAAFGAWDGRLFLAGGDDNFVLGGQSDEVNIYDIATATWSGLGATMPTSTAAPGWTQVNEYLYVVGGWGDDSPTHNITATQRYNMAHNNWELGPTFASERSDFVLAATGRYLYAIGGDAKGGGAFNAVTLTERLDYTAWPGGAWTDINDPLPKALTAYNSSFCTTAKSGGEIWSVGGMVNGSVFTSTSQYRPSEPCVTIPPTVTLTFNARVTASPGRRITNTAQFDDHGYLLNAVNTFVVPSEVYLPLVLRNH